MGKYIRLLWTKEDGTIDCCTCDAVLDPKTDKVDAGHCIGANHEATRWVAENVHPQCHTCNHVAQNGMAWKHIEYIRLTHGEETYKELLTLAEKGITFTSEQERIEWTMKQARQYKQMYEKLLGVRNE